MVILLLMCSSIFWWSQKMVESSMDLLPFAYQPKIAMDNNVVFLKYWALSSEESWTHCEDHLFLFLLFLHCIQRYRSQELTPQLTSWIVDYITNRQPRGIIGPSFLPWLEYEHTLMDSLCTICTVTVDLDEDITLKMCNLINNYWLSITINLFCVVSIKAYLILSFLIWKWPQQENSC